MTEQSSAANNPQALPMLPLRDVVVYPFMVIPLFVGRDKSIAALEAAMEQDQPVFLLAQLSPSKEDPKVDDLHQMGTIANVLQMLKLPDGTVKVLVEGVERAQVVSLNDTDQNYFVANVERVKEFQDDPVDTEAMRRTLLSQFEQLSKLNKKIPTEVVSSVSGIEDISRLVDTVAAHLQIKLEQRQELLTMLNVSERLDALLQQLEAELDILQVEKRIRGRVKRQMEKSQREYYLNEQVKAIQKELGEGDERSELDLSLIHI